MSLFNPELRFGGRAGGGEQSHMNLETGESVLGRISNRVPSEWMSAMLRLCCLSRHGREGEYRE